ALIAGARASVHIEKFPGHTGPRNIEIAAQMAGLHTPADAEPTTTDTAAPAVEPQPQQEPHGFEKPNFVSVNKAITHALDSHDDKDEDSEPDVTDAELLATGRDLTSPIQRVLAREDVLRRRRRT